MKTARLMLILACIALILPACNKQDATAKADRELTEIVKKIQIPDNGSELTSITYADKVLTYRYNVPADKMKRINAEELRDKAFREFTGNFGNQKLISKIVQANATVREVYYNATDSIMFSFTPEELKTALSTK